MILFAISDVHPEIRRGSPQARALNEGTVGTNWRFLTFKPPYLRNGARYDEASRGIAMISCLSASNVGEL